MQQKSTTISLIVGAVILVVIALVASRTGKKASAPQPPPAKTEVKNPSADYKLEGVDVKQLPSLLPTDLPVEANAIVQQNFQGVNDQTHTQQATRVYVSSKTLQENYDLYKKYFETHGWVMASNQTSAVALPKAAPQPSDGYNTSTLKVLTATKDKATLTVTMTLQNKQNIVNVTIQVKQ